ncbi:uncharacterized protein LOC119023775 isoform X5 [Xyrichtys novacula]|uniref:Uncharacterized protein LOC119023775 isoform X5 n=1 Tax=Xyrichtys novacula TaxID=13765 RepID=A0AAV1EIC8_XYRNO|nr:uncharacterized protein LOC119023775 isoform X5 [Xyrichtys novacula]
MKNMSTRRSRISPDAEAIKFISTETDKACLKVQWINDYKGRGVFTCAPIEKGSFVVEYRGELISQNERDKRQKKYTEKQSAFLFDFIWNNTKWCIDASNEDDSMGRLVNDAHKSPNCKMKKMTVQFKPHLCLFAIKDIQAGSEITYDYGESEWPWRVLVSNYTPSAENPTQPSAKPQEREGSSPTLHQANCTTEVVPIQKRATAKQKLKRRHAQCEEGHDEAKKKLNKRERQKTLSLIPIFKDSISTDESSVSDNTDDEDIDYVPATSDSSDSSLGEDEVRVKDTHTPPKNMPLVTAMANSEVICDSEMPTSSTLKISSHSTTVISCSLGSSGCSSPKKPKTKKTHESVEHNPRVSPLPNTAKRSKYNKKQHCLYCKKAIYKLARHLESAHNDQPDVAKALSFDKRSRQRRELLRSLKKMGNFEHNATVASCGTGEMVACRRPAAVKSSNEYRHCKFCQGLYARDCLWRHVKKCPKRPFEEEPCVGQKRIYLDLPKPEEVHEAVWKIACEMNQDSISSVVRSERDILRLGESLYNVRKPQEKRNDYIRQKMREMARLLITARAMTPLKSTEDLVMPTNFPLVIKAVRAVAGYEVQSNSYKIPSLALKLGHSLAKVAGIVQCNAIIANRHAVAESAKQFATLYEKKWNECISASALGTLTQAKWNKPQVLPFTQDVSLLHRFLATESAKCMKDMEENPNSTNFGNLAKLTLTQVVLFNRKRQGEVSKIELQAFTSRNRSQLNPDIMMCLSDLEKKLAKHFDRVEIRGKRSRMVPVLLTPDMISAMDLLVKNRHQCQVHAENAYLFARPGVLSHYRGSDCLRSYAKQCGAKYPEALTSTRLRKQVATLSTVLNLKENEMDQLASFLGHDIRVHREFYRLPESTLQLAKVSKLLMAMEKGQLSDLQGKGLDDIMISPDDEVDTSDEDSGEETVADPHQQVSIISQRREESSSGQVSRTKTSGDQSHGPDSTTRDNMEGTSVGMTLDNENVNTQPDDIQQDEAENATIQVSPKCSSGKQDRKARRQWAVDEVKAVERHMLHFITSCKVPGKKVCDSCIRAEPVALKDRDWVAVKYYIHNRITTLKRKMNK